MYAKKTFNTETTIQQGSIKTQNESKRDIARHKNISTRLTITIRREGE